MKNKRSAKIVATIGPASSDENSIRQLILAGMNVTRLNFSHGDYDTHTEVFHRIRRISAELHQPVCILQDLQGPKIRIREIEGGQTNLVTGQDLTLTTLPNLGNQEIISVDYPELLSSVKPGNHILLDDGNLELEVLSINKDQVKTRVVLGGMLKSHKGVNFPGSPLAITAFTQKDHQDLIFGLDLGVDAIAISFIRKPEDLFYVRRLIETNSPGQIDIPLIAKLERPEALENLEAIIDASDGVMVARGDLGVEMPPETVPIAQKKIISTVNQKGKLVITATQMLESMISKPRPTRAEASDVANAIFDGSDAVMLSGETAMGSYPIQAVRMMDAIVRSAEAHSTEWGKKFFDDLPPFDQDDTYYITRAAEELAHDRNVTAIATFTKSGRTALMMSKTRPDVPIYALTPDQRTCQRMCLFWGVYPIVVPLVNTLEEVIRIVDQTLVNEKHAMLGEQIVLVCGFPIQAVRKTNLTLLHTVGEIITPES